MAGRWLTAVFHQYLPDLFRLYGCTPLVRWTEAPGHATVLARQLAPEVRLLVAVGGDGTVSEVARGLAGTDCPLGIIRAGTANMLAKELGIPANPLQAVPALLGWKVRRIDLFRVNGVLGAVVAGAGLDGGITRWMKGVRRGHIGYVTYLEGLRRELHRSPAPRFHVVVDGHRLTDAYQVIITNARLYAGFFPIAPGNRPDDGLLEVFSFAGGGGYRPYRHLAALAFGQHGRLKDISHQRGTHIRVQVGEEVAYQVDGDFAGTGSFTVEVVPRALAVVAPEAGRARREARNSFPGKSP
jgi:diacylglycerol kinase family enzyme